MRDENLNSSKIQNSPPDICTDSSSLGNASSNISLNVESDTFTQDDELLNILEEFQEPIKETIGENDGSVLKKNKKQMEFSKGTFTRC